MNIPSPYTQEQVIEAIEYLAGFEKEGDKIIIGISKEALDKIYEKAKKFDKLELIVSVFYQTPIDVEDPTRDDEDEGDLSDLGEAIASHLGYL